MVSLAACQAGGLSGYKRGMSGRRKLFRNLAPLLVLTLVLALGHRSALIQLFDPRHLRATLAADGAWAPFAFVGFYVVAVVIALPATPLTLVGGFLFGPLFGTLYNVFGATVGAALAFIIARRIGQEAMQARLKAAAGTGSLRKLGELEAGFARHGLWFMLFLRLVPLFPFNVINYAAGLTRISLCSYLVATAVGIVPGTAVYTYLGDAAATASPWRFLAAFGLLGLLALIPVVYRTRQSKRALGDLVRR